MAKYKQRIADRILERKVLGKGALTAKLEVEAHAFSKSAEAAIQAVGGTVVKL